MLPRHVFVGLFVPLGFDVVRPAAQADDTRLSSREGGSSPMTVFLDTERGAVRIIRALASGEETAFWGDTEIAAPLIKSPL